MPTLADFLSADHITWLSAQDKNGALRELLGLLSTSKFVTDAQGLQNAIFSREVMMSTGVGYGVAVPHAKLQGVEQFVLAMGVAPTGIPYGSEIDDQPVRLICMIVGPEGRQDVYLRLLSTVMKFIKSEKGLVLAATHREEIRRYAAKYDVTGM